MKRSLLRILPTAASLAALLFAALAPGLRAREAAPATAGNTGCEAENLASATSTLAIPPLTGVFQPFDGTAPLAACSLAVDLPPGESRMAIVAWNPLALAPDPATVALRTRHFNASELHYNHARANFTPPIVARSVDGVAEVMRTTLAMRYEVTTMWYDQQVHYWPDGPVGMPGALSYAGGPPAPVPGPHPVLGVTFCPGGPENLRVLQGVNTTTTLMGFGPYEYLQRFRVPERSTLQWVELAFGTNWNVWPIGIGKVAIFDSQAMPAPATVLPAPIFEADFSHPGVDWPTWDTHFAGAPPVVLEPHHDYWLLARTVNNYPIYVRDLTGGEGPDFQARIGPLHSRATATGDWSEIPGRALSFRLLGEPGPPPVSVTPFGAPGLRLRVEPNPARGAALVRWSGARGEVRLEVLDPRGRRVASHAAAGAEGTWRWLGGRDGGASFAPGVYFVRAVDGAGERGAARVVLIR